MIFESLAADLDPSVSDSNGVADAFLWDRAAQEVRLLSRSTSEPARSVAEATEALDISHDGRWVLLRTSSQDLVSGLQFDFHAAHIYLFDREAGVVRLLTHSAGAPTHACVQGGQNASFAKDARWIALVSLCSDLAPGQIESGERNQVYLYDRLTGTSRLVSHAAENAAVGGNRDSRSPVISADGRWIGYTTGATDLDPDVTGLFMHTQAVLYDVQHNRNQVVTLINGTESPGSGHSAVVDISADGQRLLIESVEPALLAGQVDDPHSKDVFVYDRGPGQIRLVSSITTDALRTSGSEASAHSISADGRWVLFASHAADLVTAADSNGGSDVFLRDLQSNVTLLVSSINGAGLQSGAIGATPMAMTEDASGIVFAAGGDDWLPGMTAMGKSPHLYLLDRGQASLRLLDHVAGSPLQAADTTAMDVSIDALGTVVVYASAAGNIAPGVADFNQYTDVFAQGLDGAAAQLISRSANIERVAGAGESMLAAISADGRWALLQSEAADLVENDRNQSSDVFLADLENLQLRQVSRGVDGAAADGVSVPIALDAGGGTVIFDSLAQNLVAGYEDPLRSNQVFAYRREVNEVKLVSHRAGSATIAGNGTARGRAISADGRFVLFESDAQNLLDGQISGVASQVYLKDLQSGSIRLISRSFGQALQGADNGGEAMALDADAEFIVYTSKSSDVLPSPAPTAWSQLYLFERDSGLVQRISSTPDGQPSNGDSFTALISPDGQWVVFTTLASNLVAGVVDGNGASDVYAYHRSTGQMRLISAAANSPLQTAAGYSSASGISDDGARVVYTSTATGLMAGQIDNNSMNDVFLYDMSTGRSRLVSSHRTNSAQSANSASEHPRLSRDGRMIVFRSYATDLVAGRDAFGTSDLFVANVESARVELISHHFADARQATGMVVRGELSADGRIVAMSTLAAAIDASAADGNRANDLFVTRGAGVLFADDFE